MAIGISGGYLFNLVFCTSCCGERRRALFWLRALPMLLPVPALCVVLAGWLRFAVWNHVLGICTVPYAIAVATLLLCSAFKRTPEAWLLLIPYTLQSSDSIYFVCALPLLDMSHHPALAAFNERLHAPITWPISVNLSNIEGFLCIGSVCGVLILRFARSRRDEERLEAGLEAARTVQQVLIPAEIPSIPGFQVEAVYKPASQVGGDFFQIVATGAGGALIVIGDVSGEGMPAAMTVSLLVGTFRTLAHFTQSPREILAAMNRRMLARSKGGFTTCLVLRADPDGTVTGVNAGHLSPYVNSAEWSLENGLPLGLDDASTYRESTLQLAYDDHLTLMTDGIIEARSKTSELYGFERLR